MRHERGTQEWLEFNKEKLVAAAKALTRMMDKAGLFPIVQERLRKAFRFATNDGGMREAVNVEKLLQSEDTHRYHSEHAAEYLEACGVKLEDLKTGGHLQ